jgi:hypothetical protein
VGAAPLPAGSGQRRGDRGGEAGVSAAGDESTPYRPRAVRPRKNASQPALSPLVVTWIPRILRCTSAFTPVATSACAGHEAAFGDFEDQRVCRATNANWPDPVRDRVRNSSTAAPRS